MRFMVIVKSTPETEKAGALPDPQLMLEMGKYNEELMKADVLLALDGLHPIQVVVKDVLEIGRLFAGKDETLSVGTVGAGVSS